jgi:hypothetical protein
LFKKISNFLYLKKLDPREIPLSQGDAPRYIDPKEHDAEIQKLKQGLFNREKFNFSWNFFFRRTEST